MNSGAGCAWINNTGVTATMYTVLLQVMSECETDTLKFYGNSNREIQQ